MSNGHTGDCGSPLCGFGATPTRVGCTSGDGSCWTARIVGARPSPFHDEQLINATRQIREILDRLRAPENRSLSFVHTPHGTLLAWVEHGATPQDGEVTSANTPEEIAEVFGLIIEDDKTQAS